MDKILYDSDEAARYQTNISGWVNRHGHYWGADEHMARWSGATHLICKCGAEMKKNFTICEKCREKKADERFYAMPRKVWDGETPLYSKSHDKYFFDADDLADFLEEFDGDPQLIICDPIFLYKIDTDYWHEVLTEDGELPSDVMDALNELNRVIGEQKAVSWMPGAFAADLGRA